MVSIPDGKEVMRIILRNDARLNDRELAKKIGVSKLTVARKRQRLVQERAILGYQTIPNLSKIGYSMFALSILKHKGQMDELRTKLPSEIVFLASTPTDIVILSVHKDFQEYHAFARELRLVAEVIISTFGLTSDIHSFLETKNLNVF